MCSCGLLDSLRKPPSLLRPFTVSVTRSCRSTHKLTGRPAGQPGPRLWSCELGLWISGAGHRDQVFRETGHKERGREQEREGTAAECTNCFSSPHCRQRHQISMINIYRPIPTHTAKHYRETFMWLSRC